MVDYKAALDELARYYISVMEGDTHMIDDAYALLFKMGYTDEDGFEL